MSYAELSEDDDSFVLDAEFEEKTLPLNSISISSDDETKGSAVVYELTSDEDEPAKAVELRKKKQALIKNLFPNTKISNNRKTQAPQIVPQIPKPKGFELMIGGIKVHIPVKPYGCQTALMFKVITAINKSQNCLLESPTGSGKTLALLCGALAWVRHENNRISEQSAQELVSQHAELQQVTGAAGYVSTPVRDKSVTPEKYFNKPVFGHKSIYDETKQNPDDTNNRASKRQDCLDTSTEENNDAGLVKIHKKRRLAASELGMGCETMYDKPLPSSLERTELPSTPEKKQASQPDTPQNVSVPTVYYGARTHKQLQQVIKEFATTDYCGQLQMTILSSRDYSCVREFDKKTWSTRNDMCRACVKPYTTTGQRSDSNCKFYDNRALLNHQSLPPAFDLEELVARGEQIRACPYYAARGMAPAAHIVFCPYNYLIEPSIRDSMQIDLSDNIVIIDEAHNIEDICRDAATFSFTKDNIQAAIKELELVAGYRFANQDALRYVEYLLRALKSWDDWFVNQLPLIKQKAMTGNEAVFIWTAENFVQTLNNHNIGQQQYKDFHKNAELFCKRLREDPRTLLGVTQPTATLLENIDTVLGYLFRCEGKYMDDFTPALVRSVAGPDSFAWRQSQFNKSIEKETLSLRLMCMNPAVVFEGLKVARCIILASGTLTPLISLHSELGTDFPLQVSANHVIPSDRVWIGSLSTCPGGARLECSARGAGEARVQDGVGAALRCVSRATPHGVLCFLPSYSLMNKLVARWKETGLWEELNELKKVFLEARNAREHSEVMEEYYACVRGGALLLAVYRGKVSEGMDFRDHQARAVVTVGVPYPNTFDMAVKEKMKYNDRYSAQRQLLPSRDWLLVQAYRALNQAVGRCVRHRADWGGVLLLDARFASPHYTQHLSKWVKTFLGNNHHTFESLVNSPNSLESFMQNMTLRDTEDI
ncbi:PREDICTED: Fanconi anemia group J protein-like isoform X2 [Papilio polytes]|uniref:Fanconi anemia group J protein-like isoform X2 n=1 Tax=Papilio polytes TaxID=76194 RepID=UPI0006763660|nr:PREDICTED: Fanconi anemia group J protein-like isoform X2 [Papilio polytes]